MAAFQRIRFLGSAVMIGAVSVFAVDGLGQEPWRDPNPYRHISELTVEERLAERLDPARIAERAREHRLRHPQIAAFERSTHAAERPEGVITYVIDGRRNPELFLPHELFSSLLTGVRLREPLRTKQRGFFRESIRRFGFEDELFWRELERAAADLTSMLETKRVDASPDEGCRQRHRALQTAREIFGRQRFDRFLYEVVAPAAQQSSATNVSDPAAALKREAEGCP